MAVATEVSPTWGILLAKLWKEWEVPVLVLLSLTLQVILMLLGNRRKRTRNKVMRFIIWSAYMAADSVAIFALGVISSNLHEALVIGGSLSATIEVATFWAPFLLVHLGGQDTITAYALQDNELWLRHFVYLNVEIGLAIYIFARALKGSRLSILSAMMLVAGAIKYAERTWSLWSASYSRRRYVAQRVQSDYKPLPQNQSTEELVASLFKTKNDEELPASSSKTKNYKELLAFLLKSKNYEELLATKMFQQTESMFADALLQVDQRHRSRKIVVQQASSSVVSKLIEMELELMYENLYTKAKVIHYWWGFAFRFISFLLILITLISFSISALHHGNEYSPVQLSVTFVLLVVAILLEGYAAFLFLTSCRTISWLKKNGMHTASRAMKCLASLRSPSWSNSMGQYSLIRRSLEQKPMMKAFSKDMEVRITSFMKDDKVLLYVYDCKVKDYVKEGIYQYLKQAEDMYEREIYNLYSEGNFSNRKEINNLFSEGNFTILNSKGRVPLRKWIRLRSVDPIEGSVDKLATQLMFNIEFGEMVILWHIITEVCYYHDYGSLIDWKDKDSSPKVYWDWKISKNLSRYLMQLYVVSSGMLPPRGPLSEKKFYDQWISIFNPNNGTGETSNLHDQQEKLPWGRRAKVQQQKERRRRRARVQACNEFWDRMEGRNNEKNIPILDEEELRDRLKGRYEEENPVLDAALGFMKFLLNEDCSPANPSLTNNKTKCDLKWELLKEVWIELLVNAANYSKESQHAQHLSEGGEFLTHVWVLLGHLRLTDPRRWW